MYMIISIPCQNFLIILPNIYILMEVMTKTYKYLKNLRMMFHFQLLNKKKYYNSYLKISRTYEKRFKFYKLTVEDAQKRYPYAKLKTDF